MLRGTTAVGALMLCGAFASLWGVASSNAAGLTAVACENVVIESGKFQDPHCETSGVGKYETIAIPGGGTLTEGQAVSLLVALHTTVALSKVDITCTEARTTGRLTNFEEAGEHKAHGTEVETRYSLCSAHLASKTSGESCKIENLSGTLPGGTGEIETNLLTAITGPEHKVTFSAESGGSIAEFNILKEPTTSGTTCSLPKSKVVVTGTAIATANTARPSHLTFTGEGTLKANGGAATYTATHRGNVAGEPERTVGLETF